MVQAIVGRWFVSRGALLCRAMVALACCLFIPSPLVAQLVAPIAVDAVQSTDENATKPGGFSVKKEDQKIIEQFEDFERYRDKKAWAKAFKALETVGGSQANGMAPTKDGFWVPTRLKIFRNLVSLPAEGKDAYRLFNDAKAKQELEQIQTREAAGEADTLPQLKRLVEQFFITSVGDKASDRLGDALFEAGDYSGAANAWQQIIEHFPETSLPAMRLEIKRAAALARAGRMDQFKSAAARIKDKYADESLKLGGKDVSVEEYLATLARPATRPATSPTTNTANSEVEDPSAPLTLPTQDHPLWQTQFLDDSLSDKIFAQLNQNGWGQQMAGMARVVPSAVTDGKRVYVNWYGILFAVDVESGKLVWWSGHFKQLAEKFNELMQWQVEESRFTLTLAGDSLLAVALRLDKLNNQEPFRLSNIDPATGKKKWSTDTGPLSNWAFIGSPLVVDGIIYITAHPKDTQDIHLLSLVLADGKLLWEAALGQPQVGNNYRGMPVYPLPVLKYSGGMVYILTNNGAVIAFDTIGRTIDWAFTYETPFQNENQGRFWNGNMQVEISEPAGSAWIREGVLYFKDHGNKSMFALDLSGPKLKFNRVVGSETMLAGFDDKNFYLLSTGMSANGGSQTALGACDWQTGRMFKSSSLPLANEMVRPIVAGARYYIFLSLGIFEVDTTVADITRDTRAFRGADREAIGGALLRAGNKLISVSNLSITAYATGPEARAATK